MYNRTNPAVIKSILLRLSKNELIVEIEYIRTQIIELEPRKQAKYVFEVIRLFNGSNSCYESIMFEILILI